MTVKAYTQPLQRFRPKNKAELQAFLGLLNFYNIFLLHKAITVELLHCLLDSRTPWDWDRRAAASFQAVKDLLTSDSVLMQYHAELPLTLACDASPYGVGSILSHLLPNGLEAPVAYFSGTLSSAERNYGQIDKEAFVLVARVKRFHDYLYGRAFTLVTDHKPLLGILAGDRPSPTILLPSMTRWVVFLSAYQYTLVHQPGKVMEHADTLSCCPLPSPVEDPAPASSVLFIDDQTIPVMASDVARFSFRDRILHQVTDWVKRRWPLGSWLPIFGPTRLGNIKSPSREAA